jgi:hypothetical protein
MICPPCRDGDHAGCPERERQARRLTVTERAASGLCDCQHMARTEARRAEAITTAAPGG